VTVKTPTILPAAIASSSLRGDLYAMLASLLVQPPSADRIRQLATLTAAPEIPAAVAASLIRLKTAAANTDAVSVQQEYADLFIGLGRGEVVPYASWYREKKLMGAHLVRLRTDLAALNIHRRSGVHEPEDHAAALCETMALMIAQTAISGEQQASFFHTHLSSWMIRFFQELQQAPSTVFYLPVGELGEQFMLLEKTFLQELSAKEE